MDEPGPHLSGTEASGGRKIHRMRYVLAASLAAIALIFAVLLIVNHWNV